MRTYAAVLHNIFYRPHFFGVGTFLFVRNLPAVPLSRFSPIVVLPTEYGVVKSTSLYHEFFFVRTFLFVGAYPAIPLS